MVKQRTKTMIMIVVLGYSSTIIGSTQPSFMAQAGRHSGKARAWYANSTVVNAFAFGFVASVAGMMAYHYFAEAQSRKEERGLTRNRNANLNDQDIPLADRPLHAAIATAKRARKPLTPKNAAINFLDDEAEHYYRELVVARGQVVRREQRIQRLLKELEQHGIVTANNAGQSTTTTPAATPKNVQAVQQRGNGQVATHSMLQAAPLSSDLQRTSALPAGDASQVYGPRNGILVAPHAVAGVGRSSLQVRSPVSAPTAQRGAKTPTSGGSMTDRLPTRTIAAAPASAQATMPAPATGTAPSAVLPSQPRQLGTPERFAHSGVIFN